MSGNQTRLPTTAEVPDQIKDLGRKARARLQEERSKRPEIVRIDAPLIPKAGGPTAAPSTPKTRPSPTKQKKRRRPSVQAVVDDSNVDRYMPDTSHLIALHGKGSPSNVVQLHSVPKGTTVAQIRKFFAGLDPQRVLLLLPFSQTIPELDAKPRPRKSGLHIERHDPLLRILVKFESAPMAALATKRSGEALSIPDSNQGAALCVTPMSKPYASCLVQTISIDAAPGTILEAALEQLALQMDPAVPEILWASVMQTLQLQDKQKLARTDNHHSVWFQHSSNLPARHALLKQEVRRLTNALPFPRAENLDPTLTYDDPILQLYCSCVNVLTREVNRIQRARSAPLKWQFLEPLGNGSPVVAKNSGVDA